jgi:hypothetical protein
LSPNTKLVIKGSMNFDMHSNIDAVGDGLLRQGVQQGLFDAEVSTSAVSEIYVYDETGKQLDLAGMGEWVGQVLSPDGVSTVSSLGTDLNNYASDFELNFTNDTALSKTGGIWARVQATSVAGLGTLDVPEPGTWALMALGFVGVAAAIRKQGKA